MKIPIQLIICFFLLKVTTCFGQEKLLYIRMSNSNNYLDNAIVDNLISQGVKVIDIQVNSPAFKPYGNKEKSKLSRKQMNYLSQFNCSYLLFHSKELNGKAYEDIIQGNGLKDNAFWSSCFILRRVNQRGKAAINKATLNVSTLDKFGGKENMKTSDQFKDSNTSSQLDNCSNIKEFAKDISEIINSSQKLKENFRNKN